MKNRFFPVISNFLVVCDSSFYAFAPLALLSPLSVFFASSIPFYISSPEFCRLLHILRVWRGVGEGFADVWPPLLWGRVKMYFGRWKASERLREQRKLFDWKGKRKVRMWRLINETHWEGNWLFEMMIHRLKKGTLAEQWLSTFRWTF